MGDEEDLYLIATADSKLAASFSTRLILFKADNPDRDTTSYVEAMSRQETAYIIQPKK